MLLFQTLYETPANISVMQSTPGDLYGPAPDYPITTTTNLLPPNLDRASGGR